jgi:nicotinamidase/pyrazinamidase
MIKENQTMNPENTPQTYDTIVAINVDIQNDFALPDGALSVKEGEVIVPLANTINGFVREQGGSVVFTQDWHPYDTKHFAINHAEDEPGGPWPVHCVQDTAGAALHSGLVVETPDTVAHKGMSHEDDGYSGWNAEVVAGTLTAMVDGLPAGERTVGRAIGVLAAYAAERGEKLVIIIQGLATDYCVQATVLDALHDTNRDTVDVYIATDAMRPVDQTDGNKALAAMREAKAIAITTEELLHGGIIIDRKRLEQ